MTAMCFKKKTDFLLFFDKIDEIIFTKIKVLRLMLKKYVQLCVLFLLIMVNLSKNLT